MGGLKVTITGKEELIRAIEGKHSEILEAAKKGLRKAAVGIENEAKDYCSPGKSPYWHAPFDTGRLRASIDGDQTPTDTEEGCHTSVEVRGVDYALPVHEGHFTRHSKASFSGATRYSLGSESRSYVPGRPFLLDAMNAKKEESLQTVAESIRKVLE